MDNRATMRDIDSSTYKTRDLVGGSRAQRSSARERLSTKGDVPRAALSRNSQQEFYRDSKEGRLNIQERAHMKSPAFLERANKSLNRVLTWEFFGVHIHNSVDYMDRAERSGCLEFSFDKRVLQTIFAFARQIPEAAWAIHDRAMGAPYMAGAGIYLACMHFDIPMTIAHIASGIFRTHAKVASVIKAERKVTACINRMTADGFFTEHKLSYEDGVVYSIRSMLKFPEVPRALRVTPRLRPNKDGKLVRGEPCLTQMQTILKKMDYEGRRELMPRPRPEGHEDFVKECVCVWRSFVRLSNQDMRNIASAMIRDRVINGSISVETAKYKEEVELHRFKGGCLRTKKIPGIESGTFTANPQRMAVAVIMTVALRRGATKRYGRMFWSHFNFKMCQPIRLKKMITSTLNRHGQSMIGAIRDTPTRTSTHKRKRVTAVAAAARAAADAIAATQPQLGFTPYRPSLGQIVQKRLVRVKQTKKRRTRGELM